MPRIFQDGGRFGNFQMLITLLSYILRLYKWLSWLLHWAMPLVPSERSKPCPNWLIFFFFIFLSFFLLSSFFILDVEEADTFRFFTVPFRFGRRCATKDCCLHPWQNNKIHNRHTLAAGRHFESSAHAQNTSPSVKSATVVYLLYLYCHLAILSE